MKNHYEVIKNVRVTEKSTRLNAENKYIFEVHDRANKYEIADAVSALFKRKVAKVNIIRRVGKRRRTRFGVGRTSDFKTAVVTLAAGQEALDLFGNT
jgi:large subunit ribosomal protein L23